MPCMCANQIAPIIAKHSICFIRIINTVPKKKSSSGSGLWSAKEMYAVPYLWLALPLADLMENGGGGIMGQMDTDCLMLNVMTDLQP